MQEIWDGNYNPACIGLRHDVDASNRATHYALDTSVKLAEWEAERGYRATYYVLHTAHYWNEPDFADKLHRIAEYGHEIGIHADALAESFKTGRDPDVILNEAIGTLRGYGFRVRGVAGHGNPLCNRDRNITAGEESFANDEQFVECARPSEGLPDRKITRGSITRRLRPRPLSDFGLEYEALNLAYHGPLKPFRISDSGGRWLNPGWEETVERWNLERRQFPNQDVATPAVRQLHFLLHPDWWQEAFVPAAVGV